MSLSQGPTVQYGDTVMIVAKDRKPWIRTIRPGGNIQTHFGGINFDDLVGVYYGEQFRTHLGHGMYILSPSLEDILRNLKRGSQIIYPKDLAYIALKLGLRQGMTVAEAGSGSGALTCMLAVMVGDEGRVYSYDRHTGRQQQAQENTRRIGVDHRVEFIHRDIAEGFNPELVDALFLDVPGPYEYVQVARAALKGGGFFGAIVTTTNQLIDLLGELYHGAWFMLQAEELLLRSWRTIPERVRPDESMHGHTGILVFARAVEREIRHPRPVDDLQIDQDKPPIE